MDIKLSGEYRKARTGVLYTFEATYSVRGVRVSWTAKVRQDSDLRGSPHGTVDVQQGNVRELAREIAEAGIKSWIEDIAE